MLSSPCLRELLVAVAAAVCSGGRVTSVPGLVPHSLTFLRSPAPPDKRAVYGSAGLGGAVPGWRDGDSASSCVLCAPSPWQRAGRHLRLPRGHGELQDAHLSALLLTCERKSAPCRKRATPVQTGELVVVPVKDRQPPSSPW